MNKINRLYIFVATVACFCFATTIVPFKQRNLSTRNRISSAFNNGTQIAMNEQNAPSINDQIKKEVDDALEQARINANLPEDFFTSRNTDDQTDKDSSEDITSAEQPEPFDIESEEPSKSESEVEAPEPLAPIEDAPKNIREIISPALEQDTQEEGFKFTSDNLEQPLEFQHEKETVEQAQETLKELEEEKDERIEFNFENADLRNLIEYVEQLFDLTFISDETIEPLKKNGKAVKGNKISFKTNKPLSREQAWNLYTTFLEIAGFAVVPTGDPAIYRIETLPNARKSAIRSFIGVDPENLPDNDETIRYVYFIKNSTLESIVPIIDSLRSNDAPLLQLKSHKAFILTDKAYNVKKLMEIVKELDRVSMPQSMSILKLHRADAEEVKKLYESLLAPTQQQTPRVFGPRRKEPSTYFPEDTRIIAEPRTNSLILLGAQDSIKRIEDFILKHVDIDLDQPYSPLHVHQLKYADAETVADIMREVTKFGKDSPVGQAGGVRGEDKYLKEMTFVPEKATNRLIIKGDYEDYLRAKEIIEQLDEAQPQVAIEILILEVKNADTRELGAQIRKKISESNGLLGSNVTFQTSGLRAGGTPSGIVEKSGVVSGTQKLLGNLLNLVTGAGPANTIISLGRDACGVWGIFQALQTITNLQVVSNPFLMATNKTKARVSLGETRRVVTSTIAGGSSTINSESDEPAALTVEITPQINSDGMISLDFVIDITTFTDPSNPESATKTVKKIISKTIVADQEVLALGGLVRNRIDNTLSKTPILGNIPVLGWLFKNKRKSRDKENLLILVSSRIVRPETTERGNVFTQERAVDYRKTIGQMRSPVEERDPIHKLFFEQKENDNTVEDFIFKRSGNQKARQKRKSRREKRRQRRAQEKKKHDRPTKLEQIDLEAPRIAQSNVVPPANKVQA